MRTIVLLAGTVLIVAALAQAQDQDRFREFLKKWLTSKNGGGKNGGGKNGGKGGVEEEIVPVTDIGRLEKTVNSLARQLMLQQLFVEERIRSDGDSGVKQGSLKRQGTKSYFATTISDDRVVDMHDHANTQRTLGLGDFVAVLNGAEFRTGHNDYELRMPHTTSKEFQATEEIPFPDVPKEVLEKKTVSEQVAEMKEWFKAWQTQEWPFGQRDYRQYFKPVLCYLEGAWTKTTEEEAIASQEKLRFNSYTGGQDEEIEPFLPVKIMNIIEDVPIFGQWRYRILCHPLKEDLPLSALRVVDNLGARIANDVEFKDFAKSEAARFQLNPKGAEQWPKQDIKYRESYLDEIFKEIPGMDNYKGKLVDDAFGFPTHGLSPFSPALNSAFYNRVFRVEKRDAMGTQVRHRGYSDSNLYMAQTSQKDVLEMNVRDCQKVRGKKNKVCTDYGQKWSYAIPLEIIYLTPLHKWNPYNISQLSGEHGSQEMGGFTKETAYVGSSENNFYRTPSEFFNNKEKIGVLDRNRIVRSVAGSGPRVFLDSIDGVGRIRTRYPIMPTHDEGSVAWKELEALRDVVMENADYMSLMRDAETLSPEEKKRQAKLKRQKERQEKLRKLREKIKNGR